MQSNVNKPATDATATDATDAKPAATVAADKPAKPARKPRKPAARKPVKADKPATDAKPDAAALSKRIAAERADAGAVFGKLSDAVSVPVKTLTAFKRTYKADVQAHAIGRKPSVRQAAALAVAQAASGKALRDGATFPRKFTMRGATYAIENGALSDAIASGLCTYDGATETVTIKRAAEIKSQLGAALSGFKI